MHPPHITHDVITDLLKSLNVVTISEISHLKFGIRDAGYEHIQSARRQVFITPESASKLPASALMKFDDDEYHLFFNDDKVRCFLCKEDGHISSTLVP